ncbi:hypothetical protein ASF61_03950 [Duganella sp. Leaf126]|uniref:hypothetical protein n=1 Tax=Duganella sp. Leaf126 TaxID=1736266 RepID=UPI0006FFE324|nr:hypothetical protein [Duganella sp. Leaf126]KQQ39974.1 hypothetical protein ASF61_03950 [Duganella sp. Leaf126]
MKTVHASARPARQHAPTAILSCAWALGITGTTLMPLLVTNAMARLHLDEGQATMISGLEMVGMLAGCIVLPPLARRRPAATTAVALLLLAACQALTAWAGQLALFGMLRAVAGVCEAQLVVMVGICLACHRDAERLWGWVLLWSGLIAAGAFTVLSLFPAVAADARLWSALAVLTLVLATVALRVPALVPVRLPAVRPAPASASSADSAPRIGADVWMAWGVFVGAYSVQAGVWAVSALQGERLGLPLPVIGTLLALSSLLGFFGALAPALPALAGRRGLTMAAALAVMGASVACFFTARSATMFFVSQTLLNAGFYAVMALLNGFISARDRDGTLLSQSVIVTFAAVAAGTVGAGELFQDAGAVGVIVFALLALAASAPLGLGALRARSGTGAVVNSSSAP